LTHTSDTQSKLRSTDTSPTVLQQGLYHLRRAISRDHRIPKRHAQFKRNYRYSIIYYRCSVKVLIIQSL